MLASTTTGSDEALKANVLNLIAWEECILFACERLARGTAHQQDACGAAVLSAFEVDPILAAEMIYRSTYEVWRRVDTTIQRNVESWHTPGKIDRALRFMLCTGRPEFLSQVWPFFTHKNEQVQIAALRAWKGLRITILGSIAAERLAALPKEIRQNILCEIALNSGIDGLDLSATIARNDPDSEVKARVVESLAFRQADRHIIDVLHDADERTFDLLAHDDLLDDVSDESVRVGLAAARERLHMSGIQPYDLLHSIVYSHGDDDRSANITMIIAEMGLDRHDGRVASLLHAAQKRFPNAVAEGLLQRLREGRSLPHRASEMMATAKLVFEEDALLDIALSPGPRDDRVNAAASLLGPRAVGRMIASLFDVKKSIRDANGKYDNTMADRYFEIRARIGNTRASSLLTAIATRAPQATNQELAEYAELISRHPNGENDRGEPLKSNESEIVVGFVEDWGNQFLKSPAATREQFAVIARLASHAPAIRLLPLLKRLLDEDLRLWSGYKEQAREEHFSGGVATNEARTSWMLQYRWAFQAIHDAETTRLMREYLMDEGFGESAALVLAEHWRITNEPSIGRRWKNAPDFSLVAARRADRALNPTHSSDAADAIFSAIELLVESNPTDAQKQHAVTLAIVAADLPHGSRADTISKLTTIATRCQRCQLLNNLALSGETLDVGLVRHGITEVIETAQKQPWIITQQNELDSWLRILPFTDRPEDAFDTVQGLAEDLRTGPRPNFLDHQEGVMNGRQS